MQPISECERSDLFEVIQLRTDKKSTIYCSQWAPEGWLGKLGDGPLADAILDRIRNSSYTILLKGRSLRKRQVICWIENHFKKIDNYIEN